MRIRQLQTFCDLAQTLNFTKTAQRLHYAQSSVVEQIDALENYFDVFLFSREGRRLQLTAQGRELLEDAQRIVAIAADARSRLRGETLDMSVSVMAPETFCVRRLPRILKEYQASHPGSTVEVRAADRATLQKAVQEGLADVAIMLGVPRSSGTTTMFDGVACAGLGHEEMLLVGAAGHPLAGHGVALSDAAAYPLYATPQGCAFREASDAALATLSLRPAMESSSVGTLVETVAATNGLALLPAMAVESALAEGRLAIINLAVDWPTVPLLMTWREAANPKVRYFSRLARACFH